VVAALRDAVARFDRPGDVECDPAARAATLRRLEAERGRAVEWLAGRSVDLAPLVSRREGDPALFALLASFLGGLADMDRRFAETFVSNPRVELVKGHAIVLAELGLCPYRGTIVRDPRLFDGAWSKQRRAEHLLARLAFTQALFSDVTLYRAAAVDGPLPRARPRSFVSATFSREVAEAHFAGGPTTRTAVMWRQVVPAGRLLMTFAETEAMNGRFKEAEALLLGDPGNRAF
jgi:hypothetical protein